MTPADIIRDARQRDLRDEDGAPVRFDLLPPLSQDDIARLQSRLPCPIPPDVSDLLALCRGISGSALEIVDFTGDLCDFELTDVFPHGLPIAGDGYGNFWVVDLLARSTTFGPIYFACHDAPVILYQSRTLAEFLRELVKMSIPPHASLIDDVHEDRLFKVWAANPGVKSVEECLSSGDPVLTEFAKALGPTFEVIDMRAAPVGFGFSWGRYGPKTVVRRAGDEPVFAYERRESGWRTLLGRFSGAGRGARRAP